MNDPRRLILDLFVWGISAAFLCLLVAQPSYPAPPAAPDAAGIWREECGSCHIAYLPRLLPAASWGIVLDRLDKHFGVDASLDAGRVAAIRTFLGTQPWPSGSPTDAAETPRISTAAWFRREHSEIREEVWRRPSIRGSANCAACHTAAERGDFNEDGIRIPK